MTATTEAIDLARLVGAVGEESQAEDVRSFDVSGIMGICEVFVLLTGRNSRHVSAVVDEIVDRCEVEMGRTPRSTEGLGDKRWVLVDYGDVVVHVFLPEDRSLYRLERLYDDAPAV